MIHHDPLRHVLRVSLTPAGLHWSLRSSCWGARCGFVSKALQGGLAALRCILPHGRAERVSQLRAWRVRCALAREVTHA